MIEDQAIKYNTSVIKVEMLIDELNELGLNTEDFLNALNEIKSYEITEIDIIKNNSGFKNVISMKDASITALYSDLFNKVNTLINTIEKYDIYLHTMYECKKISIMMHDKINNKETIDSLIDTLIKCLKDIRESDTLVYSEEEKLVNELYNKVYEAIKLELSVFDKSKLLEYCSNYEIDTIRLSKLIETDVKNYHESNIESVKYIFNSVKSKKLSSMYLNEKLIKSLLDGVDYNNTIEDIKNIILEYSRKFNKNSLEIDKVKQNILETEASQVQLKKDIKNITRSKISNNVKSVLSLALTGSILFGIGFGIKKISEELGKKPIYDTTYSYVNTLTNENESHSLNEKSISSRYELAEIIDGSTKKYTTLTIYEPYEKKGGKFVRKTYSYNLTDIVLDNSEDYLKLDLEKLGRKAKVSKEIKSELNTNDLYEENYYELFNIVQDISNETESFDEYTRDGFLIIVGFSSLFAFALAEDHLFSNRSSLSILYRIKECYSFNKKQNSTINNNKRSIIINKNKIKELKREIEKLINENQEIKLKYENFLRENDNYIFNSRDIQSLIKSFDKEQEMTLELQ